MTLSSMWTEIFIGVLLVVKLLVIYMISQGAFTRWLRFMDAQAKKEQETNPNYDEELKKEMQMRAFLGED